MEKEPSFPPVPTCQADQVGIQGLDFGREYHRIHPPVPGVHRTGTEPGESTDTAGCHRSPVASATQTCECTQALPSPREVFMNVGQYTQTGKVFQLLYRPGM